MRIPCFVGFTMLLAVITGCVSDPVPPRVQSSPAAGLADLNTSGQEGGLIRQAPTESMPDPTDIVTLRDAVSLALLKNPELSGAAWEIRAAEAKELQAGVVPNPEIGLTAEEFGGNQIRKDFGTAKTTVQLSQLVELGGKRAKRVRLARLEKDLAGWDYEVKRLDVLTRVSKTFVEVLAAQEQEALAKELVGLAEKVLNSVSERVEAGKISPLEETKSAVALSSAKIDRDRARSSLMTARYKLAATWGQESPTFQRAEGDLYEVKTVPSLDEIKSLISRNPDVARYIKELEQRLAALEVQKAKGVPDFTLSGGVQHFAENDENALVVGLTVPVPIFDRNQGGIMEARHKLSKAKEEYRAARVKASSALGEAFNSLSASHVEMLSLKNDVLPAAEQAYNASQEGFREGKFDFLELLDAQRTLFSARVKYIESLAACHKESAELERLIGERLDAVLNSAGASR